MNLTDLRHRQDLNWDSLDGKLNATEVKEFIRQFKELFKSNKAREAKEVVYAWITKKRIPRLRGKSNIIYFGKTIQTLYDRHYHYAKTEGNKDNWPRYRFIINKFGPITVYFAKTPNPKDAESQLLKKYYDDHFEYPPINRTSR